jgi:hypothetical protein
MNRPSPGSALFGLLLFAYAGSTQAADPKGFASLGVQYDGWNTITTEPYYGSEFFLPFSFSYAPDPNWILSGQSSFAAGSYTDSIFGTNTQNLSALTASSLTSDLYFTGFGIPNMVEVTLNMPTGDPSWETRQVASNIPTVFFNTRYQSEGWGVNALYGISIPAGGNVELGVSAGYSYTGAYNPNYGNLASVQLKMGDSLFLALNRVESFADNKSSTFRLSAMAFLPTQENGLTDFQMGPNGSASYTFYDPAGFSWSLGLQIYTLAQRYYYDPVKAVVYGLEPYGSSGERFYFTPSLALGNLNLGALFQVIFANGYPLADYSGLYNGGGVVLGFNPSYALPLDAASSLNLNGGLDYIIAFNASSDYFDTIHYGYWTLGASYQIKIF